GVTAAMASCREMRKNDHAKADAPGDRHAEAGEQDGATPANRASPAPGGVHPREGQPLRSVGRPTRRSVGGRVSRPGDRAPKRYLRGGPTRSSFAEGHGGGPNKVDLGPPPPPESKTSAYAHTPHAREPGDLEGAARPMVGSGQPREGAKPQSVETYFE